MRTWFERLHFQFLRLANEKWGTLTLLFFAFADASFFPLPVTTFFLILILMNPKKTLIYSFFVVSGTFAGALGGYFTGHFVWLDVNGEITRFAHFLLTYIPGFSSDFYSKAGFLYEKWGFWILSFASITPIPYGVFSILSGVFEINIIVFSSATLICQGIKFSLLALLALKSGNWVKKLQWFKIKPSCSTTPNTYQ
jgi:membrane protein YqaA with SNARE-associated domain